MCKLVRLLSQMPLGLALPSVKKRHLHDAELYAGEIDHGFRPGLGQQQSMVTSGMNKLKPCIRQAKSEAKI